MSFHLPSWKLRLRGAGLHWRAFLLGLIGTVWLGLAAGRGGYWDRPGPRVQVRRIDPADVVVLDGDTVRVAGRDYRLLGVDTPERNAPWFEGAQEPWAGRATEFVRRAVAEADEIALHSRGVTDLHERELAHLFVDGRPLSLMLVEAGLAYPTVHRFGDGGFPELASEIARAARPPAFQPPWKWRRAHRISNRP